MVRLNGNNYYIMSIQSQIDKGREGDN
jgi:hypothetical protein